MDMSANLHKNWAPYFTLMRRIREFVRDTEILPSSLSEYSWYNSGGAPSVNLDFGFSLSSAIWGAREADCVCKVARSLSLLTRPETKGGKRASCASVTHPQKSILIRVKMV